MDALLAIWEMVPPFGVVLPTTGPFWSRMALMAPDKGEDVMLVKACGMTLDQYVSNVHGWEQVCVTVSTQRV